MIKTIITMVVTAIAGLIGYLVSDSFRERLAQRQRDKIASEVASGDQGRGGFLSPKLQRLCYNSQQLW